MDFVKKDHMDGLKNLVWRNLKSRCGERFVNGLKTSV